MSEWENQGYDEDHYYTHDELQKTSCLEIVAEGIAAGVHHQSSERHNIRAYFTEYEKFLKLVSENESCDA